MSFHQLLLILLRTAHDQFTPYQQRSNEPLQYDTSPHLRGRQRLDQQQGKSLDTAQHVQAGVVMATPTNLLTTLVHFSQYFAAVTLSVCPLSFICVGEGVRCESTVVCVCSCEV